MQGVKPKFGHRILARGRAISLVIPDLLLLGTYWLKRRNVYTNAEGREHLGEPCDRQKSFHTIYLPDSALHRRRDELSTLV